MKRGDRIMLKIFLVMAVTAGALWVSKAVRTESDAVTAEISQDGKLLWKLMLKKGDLPREFTVEYRGRFNRIRTQDGKIAVVGADCPDKDCVKRGWLKKPGDSAVCLPNRLVIRITGQSEIDGVTW